MVSAIGIILIVVAGIAAFYLYRKWKANQITDPHAKQTADLMNQGFRPASLQDALNSV